jgi:hypothetical protein
MWVVAWLAVGCGGVQSICATESGLEVEPNLTAQLAAAVDYWESEGHGGFIVTNSGSCDIPVRRGETGEVPSTSSARSIVTYVAMTDECIPRYVMLNAKDWPYVQDEENQVRVLAHEIGHLHCLEHTESGVMSETRFLDEFSAR